MPKQPHTKGNTFWIFWSFRIFDLAVFASPEAATLCQLDTGDCTDLARFGGGPGVPKIAPAKRYTVLSTIFRWQGSGSTAIFDDFCIFLCIFAGGRQLDQFWFQEGRMIMIWYQSHHVIKLYVHVHLIWLQFNFIFQLHVASHYIGLAIALRCRRCCHVGCIKDAKCCDSSDQSTELSGMTSWRQGLSGLKFEHPGISCFYAWGFLEFALAELHDQSFEKHGCRAVILSLDSWHTWHNLKTRINNQLGTSCSLPGISENLSDIFIIDLRWTRSFFLQGLISREQYAQLLTRKRLNELFEESAAAGNQCEPSPCLSTWESSYLHPVKALITRLPRSIDS